VFLLFNGEINALVLNLVMRDFYFSKYQHISSLDQRNMYKQEFNLEYEEYRNLHKNVEKVTQKFANLEVKMRQAQQGTEEFEVSQLVMFAGQ